MASGHTIAPIRASVATTVSWWPRLLLNRVGTEAARAPIITSAAASVATYRPLQALKRTRGTGPTGRGFGDAGDDGPDA